MGKKTKTDYSHPYVVVYHGNLPPHPRYATLAQAIGNVRGKLNANVEWAKKFSSESIVGILDALGRLDNVVVVEPGKAYHDRVVVDEHTGTALDFAIVNNEAA